ncbi:MAG TPA: cytochrome c [Bryobacteraceae bacterium]|jgi:mono/diheme cytochrome c family protein
MLSVKLALSLMCVLPVVTLAGDAPVVKKVNAATTSPASGPEMFRQYCAACHGADAKGHGPAAIALKIPPPDLTVLSKNNHGKFPDVRVYSSIRGDATFSAHGSSDMPVWGTLFRDMANNSGDDRQAAMRLSNLCRYIESVQQK